MIWNSTNYFNQKFVTETGITKKKYADKTTFVVFAVIQGVTHNLGESDTQEDAQKWLDKWKSDGEKAVKDDYK